MIRDAATVISIIFCFSSLSTSTTAQEPGPQRKYSDEVVEKAKIILGDAGLRQSGKAIQATGVSEINRAISGLSRDKRELLLIYRDWKEIADGISRIRGELQRLNAYSGDLGLQLARVAGVDVAANNRIVGLMNATNAKTKALVEQRDRLKSELTKRRGALNDAETAYAETVLAIREDYTRIRNSLHAALEKDDVKVAMKVMSTNFATPENVTADEILSVLDNRIERIEQEVFSETIPLVVEQRSMYVDVVVGRKSTRMVVDSGATMICLPQSTATELDVIVPANAREMRLVLADGRAIPARGVTLPRVRVGEFEAENVEAAVLDAAAIDAEPLLGMSFLGNFKFELNAADQTLKMLRVSTD